MIAAVATVDFPRTKSRRFSIKIHRQTLDSGCTERILQGQERIDLTRLRADPLAGKEYEREPLARRLREGNKSKQKYETVQGEITFLATKSYFRSQPCCAPDAHRDTREPRAIPGCSPAANQSATRRSIAARPAATVGSEGTVFCESPGCVESIPGATAEAAARAASISSAGFTGVRRDLAVAVLYILLPHESVIADRRNRHRSWG